MSRMAIVSAAAKTVVTCRLVLSRVQVIGGRSLRLGGLFGKSRRTPSARRRGVYLDTVLDVRRFCCVEFDRYCALSPEHSQINQGLPPEINANDREI